MFVTIADKSAWAHALDSRPGFRSSFRDWASEKTTTPRAVVEAALAHVVRDKAEAAYFRSDLFELRRTLMDAWAKFATAKSAKVLPIRA